MGKASSSKKVARAARAGGSRRAGQRRQLGFPLTIAGVVILGLILVLVTRNDRIANAAPRVNSDHWHVPYDTYTCVPDPSTPVVPPTTTSTVPDDTTTSTSTTVAPASGQGAGAPDALAPAGHLAAAQEPTTTTVPATDTTTTTLVDTSSSTTTTTTTLVAQPGDVPGVFQAHFQDAGQDVNGIHTHGDGVMHVHPFVGSAAGRNAQLKVFMAQVGVTLNDSELSFLDSSTGEQVTYKEGTTKCQGGKDGIIQVGLWDKVEDAANGKPPNQVVTSNVGDVRLKNGHALTIAFLPKDSRIPIQPDVKNRFDNLTDVATTTTTTSVPAASSGAESSGAESSGSTESSSSSGG